MANDKQKVQHSFVNNWQNKQKISMNGDLSNDVGQHHLINIYIIFEKQLQNTLLGLNTKLAMFKAIEFIANQGSSHKKHR